MTTGGTIFGGYNIRIMQSRLKSELLQVRVVQTDSLAGVPIRQFRHDNVKGSGHSYYHRRRAAGVHSILYNSNNIIIYCYIILHLRTRIHGTLYVARVIVHCDYAK